jgi:hypothetical protein
MSTEIIYAAVATLLAIISNTAQPARAAMIISDAARSSALPQTGDLHDVTCHHRYYGSSACIGSPKFLS